MLKVEKSGQEYIVSVKEKNYVNDVFDYIKTKKNVEKFVVEEPTLNEIFIERVGESYEK